MATTALTLIDLAFAGLNVFQAGEGINPDIANDAFVTLNNMLGQWALDGLTIPAESREVFALVANKGTTANPYTIGVGGNFSTARPPSQASITGIGLLYSTPVPAVEIQRVLYTDQQWQNITVKNQTAAIFTGAYYAPTYVGGLGTITLWPVPDNATNSFVLYRRQPLTAFVSLSASYDLPIGYDEAIGDNLALRLATPYGRPLTADLKADANESLANLRRANTTMRDLAIDPMFTTDRRWGYDIRTGQ